MPRGFRFAIARLTLVCPCCARDPSLSASAPAAFDSMPSGDPERATWGRSGRLFWLAALFVLALVTWQSARSQTRVQGVFLADEAEYLLMAERLRVDGRPPVLPKRPWGLPLVIAPLLRLDAEDAPVGFDPGPARSVGSLALLVAALAAAAFAARVAGRWAGLCAFGYVGLQPELVFWSVAFLTDVPTCALAALAALCWTRERPFAAGLALGATLLLRHPALLFIGAFGIVAVGQRRWRDAAWLALGILPPLALMGALDAFLWSAPFESLGVFIADQLDAFAPEWLGARPPETLANTPEKLRAAPSALYVRERFDWYFRELPGVLTWPGLALLLSYPFVRGRTQHRRELDFVLATSVVYVLALSVLRSKEARYLVTVLPLCGAAWGAIAGLWGARALEVTRARGSRVAAVVAIGGAAALLAGYVAIARETLARRPHRPHGAIVAALPADAASARALGVDEPWKLAAHVQIRGRWGHAWAGPRLGLVNSANLFGDLARKHSLPGDDKPRKDSAGQLLDACDAWILPQAWSHQDQLPLWEWMNRNAEVDGLFHDPHENGYAVLRFRRAEGGVSTPCLWELSPAAPGPALARFEGGLELRSVEAQRHPTRQDEVRVEFVWFVPSDWERPVLARALFLELHPDEPGRAPSALRKDIHGLIPGAGPLRDARRGALMRLRRYVQLPDVTLQLELVVEEEETRVVLGVEETAHPHADDQRITLPLER